VWGGDCGEEALARWRVSADVQPRGTLFAGRMPTAATGWAWML